MPGNGKRIDKAGKSGVAVVNFFPGLENIVDSVARGACRRYDGIINLKGREREFSVYYMNENLFRVDIKKAV